MAALVFSATSNETLFAVKPPVNTQ